LVLLGLGILVVWSTHLHFIDLDRDYLLDKVQLIQKIVDETPEPAELSAKLDESLNSHQGLFISLTRVTICCLAPAASRFQQNWPREAPQISLWIGLMVRDNCEA